MDEKLRPGGSRSFLSSRRFRSGAGLPRLSPHEAGVQRSSLAVRSTRASHLLFPSLPYGFSLQLQNPLQIARDRYKTREINSQVPRVWPSGSPECRRPSHSIPISPSRPIATMLGLNRDIVTIQLPGVAAMFEP